ncbi:hypothetical protein L210DRAFT_3587890 [Boletus edulis BED1]|uniref:Uncharacterized protein n=1 Tax=Boletus edulis BED1 TaxID=1328754 RepID=A0AAD4B9U5_BOLED|nr:hypothetical protein L210DRAFT_3587890 [Boletus edulis BED1]
MGIVRPINVYSQITIARVGGCDGQPDIRRPFSSKLETSKLANETMKGNLIVRCHRYRPGEVRLP